MESEEIYSFVAGLKKQCDKYYKAVEVQEFMEAICKEYNVPYSVVCTLLEKAVVVFKEVDPWK